MTNVVKDPNRCVIYFIQVSSSRIVIRHNSGLQNVMEHYVILALLIAVVWIFTVIEAGSGKDDLILGKLITTPYTSPSSVMKGKNGCYTNLDRVTWWQVDLTAMYEIWEVLLTKVSKASTNTNKLTGKLKRLLYYRHYITLLATHIAIAHS